MSGFHGAQVLVTGGAGFIGANLVKHLLSCRCAGILVVDNLLSSEPANLPDDHRITFIEGSIADDRILKTLDDRFAYVFHLATYHGNQNSIADPLTDHENNLLTTLKLYDCLKGFRQLQRVVYAASGCTLAPHVFNDVSATVEEGPVPFDLDSPYQISKVVGEFYSVYYRRAHGLPTVRARFQNVYGPGEVLGAGRWRGTPATVWRNVVPTFIYRALKGLPLQIENEGKASRDFIYVDDIVRGLLLCATDASAGEVYNLASGVETAIGKLAELINRMTGNSAGMEFLPRREWDHSGRRFGSTEKAKRVLGFEARVSLHEGLQRTVGWTRRSLPIIEACIAKHAQHLAQSRDLPGVTR
jgi:UDP-glucose 4-epimerase